MKRTAKKMHRMTAGNAEAGLMYPTGLKHVQERIEAIKARREAIKNNDRKG